MSLFSAVQLQLIQALSDGKCYSGNLLGKALGISRAAVWKHIQHLQAQGLPIQCILRRGYQLHHPMIALCAEQIKQLLSGDEHSGESVIEVFKEIDSTNRYLRQAPDTKQTLFCFAEMQTAGRGRFGREWFSPFGENIYFSARMNWNAKLARLSGLSLMVSLAVCDALKPFIGEEMLTVKWPNDILWQQQKLAGILIELNAESHGQAQLIIGIGINVNSSKALYKGLDRPWCSLLDITGEAMDRNLLAAALIQQLSRQYHEFMHHGFAPFKKRWQQLDCLADRHISVKQVNTVIEGLAMGVDELGCLLLRDKSGKLHALNSGESSINGSASENVNPI